MGRHVHLLKISVHTFKNLTFFEFQTYAYSFVSFEVVTLRVFVAFSSRYGESFLGALHMTKHQWNISPPYAQQPDASTLVVGSSPQFSIVKKL